MTRHSSTLAQSPRNRLRRIGALIAVTVLPIALVAAGTGAAASGAAIRTGSAGGSEVTYTAVVSIPAPPSSNFSGAAGGGDGWAVALTPTQVFNVFHHQAFLGVNCHNQTDASQCWPGFTYKTISEPVNGQPVTCSNAPTAGCFGTSGQPGLYVDQATGHLFVFATLDSSVNGAVVGTPGVVCIDTTKPAADADPFCGFTALGAAGQAFTASNGGTISDPVVVGSDWYAFNYVDGTPTGSEDELLCFDLKSSSPCAKEPYKVALALPKAGALGSNQFPEPSIAEFGDQLVVPITTAPNPPSGDELACFDTATLGVCPGKWPVSTASYSYPPLGFSGGGMVPLLSSSGAPTGLCLPVSSTGTPSYDDPCFSLAGAPVATPKGLTSVVAMNFAFDGPGMVLGSRVYVPQGTLGGGPQTVACYDYSTLASCPDFPKAFNNLSILYTVNPDPQRPTCFWVNADGGASQIQNFDAYTGGACGAGPVRVLASSVVAPDPTCTPSSWKSLEVVKPPRSGYSTGSVAFDSSDGNSIPSVPIQPLDRSGSVDLARLALSGANSLPQFLITLNNPSPPLKEVEVKLTWSGTYSPSCLQPGTTASAPPPGYRLEGGDGGIFDFHQPYHGSVGFPSPPGLGLHIFNFVAMAPIPGGYWLAQRDGGVFSFGDARFHGSLPASGTTRNDIVGIAATPDGGGYWLTASDGTVYPFGDAARLGSLSGPGVAADDIVAIVSPDAGGYWLVGRDGGVFGIGDAHFHGSCPSVRSGCEGVGDVVGAASPDVGGYWLVGSDGGVFSFGDARYRGSCPLTGSPCPNVTGVVGISSPDRGGYWVATSSGEVYTFGDAKFFGSCPQVGSGCQVLVRPVVAIS